MFDFLVEMSRWTYDPVRDRVEAPITASAEGALFERWFLKTALNFLFAFGASFGGLTRPIRTPPREIAEMAFGLRPFPKGAGLYMVHGASEVPEHMAGFSFQGLGVSPNLTGALFRVMQYRFLITWAGLPTTEADLLFPDKAEYAGARLHHRVGSFTLRSLATKFLVRELLFNWPQGDG